MKISLYGIPNCTTVKKARAWLEARRIAYNFVDYKKTPLTLDQVTHWESVLGWEALLKKTGTTWRALPDEAKQDLSRDKVLPLIVQHPNLLRRPMIELEDGHLLAGFDETQYQQTFSQDRPHV